MVVTKQEILSMNTKAKLMKLTKAQLIEMVLALQAQVPEVKPATHSKDFAPSCYLGFTIPAETISKLDILYNTVHPDYPTPFKNKVGVVKEIRNLSRDQEGRSNIGLKEALDITMELISKGLIK
jgi:hypothetical protein